MENVESVTLVTLTYQRPLLLRKCLSSISSLQLPSNIQFSVIIGINGTDPESQDIVQDFCLRTKSFPVQTLASNFQQTPAAFRNQLVKLASASWIYFVDDDVELNPQILQAFGSSLAKFPGASIIGGPNLTPPSSSLFEEASGLAFASKFGSYLSHARYRPVGDIRPSGEESLILCNLFVKSEAARSAPFPAHFVCCEESWVVDQLKRAGHQAIYNPQLAVFHQRRASAFTLARQVYRYGFGRGQMTRANAKSSRLAHFVPALSFLYALILFPLVAVSKISTSFFMVPVVCYIGLAAFSSLGATTSPQPRAFARILTAFLFPLVHFFYAMGFVGGMASGGHNG